MARSKPITGSTRTGKAAHLVSEARKLATQVESWADFSNALFDPEHGLVPRAFPDRNERRVFLKSAEYAEIDRLLGRVIDRFGVAAGATPRKSGKFVVRVPKSLHLALEREAAAEGVSLNQLVVAKLAIALANRAR